MEIFVILITIGLLATTGALVTGIVSMARGGQFDQAHSTQLMFARVGLQAVTLLCLLVVLYLLV
ncbi:MAG: twin transmembrane helix small protein [Acidiferrobacterales bacterium]